MVRVAAARGERPMAQVTCGLFDGIDRGIAPLSHVQRPALTQQVAVDRRPEGP